MSVWPLREFTVVEDLPMPHHSELDATAPFLDGLHDMLTAGVMLCGEAVVLPGEESATLLNRARVCASSAAKATGCRFPIRVVLDACGQRRVVIWKLEEQNETEIPTPPNPG